VAPATSKSQHKFMSGICQGNITPPKGLTKKQACEFIKGQDPKDLPETKAKLEDNL